MVLVDDVRFRFENYRIFKIKSLLTNASVTNETLFMSLDSVIGHVTRRRQLKVQKVKKYELKQS